MSVCTVHQVQQNTKWKVRCLSMYHNLIFAGCSDQILRIFAPYQRTKNKNSIEYQCIKSEKLSGREIKQLEIIEYVDLLIAIIDDTVVFYSLYTTRELGHAIMDQSTIRFDVKKLFDAEDEGKGTVIVTCSKAWSDGLKKKLFIAFGKRREISVYQWKGSVASNLQDAMASQVLKKYNSYPIPDKPRLLILAGKTMFVGFKEQYDLIHLETQLKQKVFGTGRRNNALGIRLINKEVLLVVDKKGYFVNYEAKPTRSKCIEYTDYPLDVTYFHPFIVSVLNKSIEIHHVSTSNLIHKIDFKNGKFSCSVSYKNSGIWNSFISLASQNDIISLSESLISDELKYLKENKHFEEALSTINLYENTQFDQEGLDKYIKKRQINEFFGYELFNNSEWMESVNKFIESGISCRRIISLFPTLVPAGQCKKARTKHPVDYQNVKKLDSTFKNATNEFLIPYLNNIQNKIKSITMNREQNENENDNNNSFNNNNSDDYKSDFQMILSQFDPPEEYDIDSEWQLEELIDTVYCKALIELNDSRLETFLCDKYNKCNISECEQLLRKNKKFEELVLLYQSHGQHKAALKLMEVKHAEINGIAKTIKYLQKLGQNNKNERLVLKFSEWVFKEDPNEALRIFTGKQFENDSQYNQTQKTNENNPLKLPKIESIKVIDHLSSIKTPIPTRISYLEMIIFEGNECESLFHDELIKLYLEEIFDAITEQQQEDEISREKYGLACGDIVELTSEFSLGKWGWVKAGTQARVSKVTPTPNHSIQVYVTFPETGTLGVVPKVQLKKLDKKQRIRPEKQEGRVGELRRKLIKFLKTSKYFIPTNIKNLFPKHNLLEEQAWLRAQIPQHKEALNIIVYELQDPEMAEEYCDQIWNEFNSELELIKNNLILESENNNYNKIDVNKIGILAKNKLFGDMKWVEADKIYLTLLDVYLKPPNKYKLRQEKFLLHALKMLNDNHLRVDPIAVFNKLPENIKVKNCLKYMESVFKSCFEKKRQYQVKKNLLKQASLKLSARKNRKEESFQRISENTKCTKCNKRIGQAAFVRYPDSNVFHYVCVRHSNINSSNNSNILNIHHNTSILHDIDNDDQSDENTFDID
eukprot:438277_1